MRVPALKTLPIELISHRRQRSRALAMFLAELKRDAFENLQKYDLEKPKRDFDQMAASTRKLLAKITQAGSEVDAVALRFLDRTKGPMELAGFVASSAQNMLQGGPFTIAASRAPTPDAPRLQYQSDYLCK